MSRTVSAFTLSALLFLTFFAIFTSASPTNATHSGRDIETRGVTYSGKATWFYVGVGACGFKNVDSDFIVALAQPNWDSGSHCNKQLQITNPANQRTKTATVRDLCPGCSSGDLDLSPSLFEALGHALSDGTFQMTWKYV